MTSIPDLRYAQVDDMFAVMHWDKHDSPEMVAETRELADRYIAGQWSDEYYSIAPIKVVRALPEPRTLYIISARVHSDPAKETRRQVDDYKEFPGLGNGAMVRLDQVDSKVSENVPYGWDVHVAGWDLEQVEAAFSARMDEAVAVRAARLEQFNQYSQGVVVVTTGGETLMRSADADGLPCWRSPAGRKLYDAQVDPSTLTRVSAPGGGR